MRDQKVSCDAVGNGFNVFLLAGFVLGFEVKEAGGLSIQEFRGFALQILYKVRKGEFQKIRKRVGFGASIQLAQTFEGTRLQNIRAAGAASVPDGGPRKRLLGEAVESVADGLPFQTAQKFLQAGPAGYKAKQSVHQECRAEQEIRHVQQIENIHILQGVRFKTGHVGEGPEGQQGRENENQDNPGAFGKKHIAEASVEAFLQIGEVGPVLLVEGGEENRLAPSLPEMDAAEVGERPQVDCDKEEDVGQERRHAIG